MICYLMSKHQIECHFKQEAGRVKQGAFFDGLVLKMAVSPVFPANPPV
jgi:hypothetical protein